ncbi:hypothetical protein AAFC00_002321 [Neodothiora populina]|uniref:AN1-type domain-containing protein n=1 Tax=Neodothiora populina TaxID=2781224 RepID=A0ABR3PHF1_9PEZI
MWRCDFQACRADSVRVLGDCMICNQHLCYKHLKPEHHKCPPWEDAEAYEAASRVSESNEIKHLLETINISALHQTASSLRNGMICSVSTTNLIKGGMNVHLEIVFDDGVVWLARIRRHNATSPPPALRDHILRSEAATLHFLEGTRVPAPKVFRFAFEHETDNPVGVSYLIYEKLPENPL